MVIDLVCYRREAHSEAGVVFVFFDEQVIVEVKQERCGKMWDLVAFLKCFLTCCFHR